MKIESKKDALVIAALLAGSALILIGMIKCIYNTNIVYSIITSDAIWFGLILFGYAWYAANKPETEILPDERTERNIQKAGYATFWIMLASAGLMLLVDGEGWYNFEIVDALFTILFVGLVSFFILDFYYNKRGIEYILRTVKENKALLCVFFILIIISTLVLVLMYFPSLRLPENLENVGFVDGTDILKCGDNFTEYGDIKSAKQALADGNIFLFFAVYEDYPETGRVTIYTREGIFSDFVPTTTIEGFLRKNLMGHANVSDEIIREFEDSEITEITESEIDTILKQANVGDKLSRRIKEPVAEEKVIVVKTGDIG